MSAPAPILRPSEAHLERCAEFLGAGELVAVPTETVYGLAGHGLDEASLRRIFAVKGRPLIDPLILHVPAPEVAEKLARFNEAARRLAERFWPGPLTLVLPKAPAVPDLATAGLPSVALRSPAHPVLRALLQRLDFPLAAPSANPFGYISPTRPEHVRDTLGTRIAAVLDGGPCEYGIESTIVDLRRADAPRILRPGPLTAGELGEALGRPVATDPPGPHGAEPEKDTPRAAPGTLARHYSPRTPLDLLPNGAQPPAPPPGVALVLERRPPPARRGPHTYWLSEDGDPREQAAHLYDLLLRLDNMGYRRILAERVVDAGIGTGVNDRLARAAAR